jgi:leucyl-tRNA synthetase
MSKSLKNVINPDDIIATYGADSMRMYEMFMGPLQVSKPWSTEGLIGIYRFLDRVWRIHEDKKVVDQPIPEDLDRLLNKTIKKVTEDTDSLNFNTAISQMMVLVNELYKSDTVPTTVYETLLLLLSPYVPHLAEELWQLQGHQPSVTNHSWPTYDEEKTHDPGAGSGLPDQRKGQGQDRRRQDGHQGTTARDGEIQREDPEVAGRQDDHQGDRHPREAGQPGGQIRLWN